MWDPDFNSDLSRRLRRRWSPQGNRAEWWLVGWLHSKTRPGGRRRNARRREETSQLLRPPPQRLPLLLDHSRCASHLIAIACTGNDVDRLLVAFCRCGVGVLPSFGGAAYIEGKPRLLFAHLLLVHVLDGHHQPYHCIHHVDRHVWCRPRCSHVVPKNVTPSLTSFEGYKVTFKTIVTIGTRPRDFLIFSVKLSHSVDLDLTFSSISTTYNLICPK